MKTSKLAFEINWPLGLRAGHRLEVSTLRATLGSYGSFNFARIKYLQGKWELKSNFTQENGDGIPCKVRSKSQPWSWKLLRIKNTFTGFFFHKKVFPIFLFSYFPPLEQSEICWKRWKQICVWFKVECEFLSLLRFLQNIFCKTCVD